MGDSLEGSSFEKRPMEEQRWLMSMTPQTASADVGDPRSKKLDAVGEADEFGGVGEYREGLSRSSSSMDVSCLEVRKTCAPRPEEVGHAVSHDTIEEVDEPA